jgi:micrococcal nuclease
MVLAIMLALGVSLQWLERAPAPVRERVTAHFSLCGPGRSNACVIDGDTIKIGARKIRVEGIDAPEMAGHCAEESALAIRARDRLRALLNEGPFVALARGVRSFDQYGRELRRIERGGRDLGAVMVAERLAHHYRGHKEGWCPVRTHP